MQRAKAAIVIAVSAFVAVASLYQIFLLLWTGEIFSWFFFNRGHYISFTEEPLLAVVQVPIYLIFAALGGYGVTNPLSDD